MCFMESWREINLAIFALGEKGKIILFSYLGKKIERKKTTFFIQCKQL